jgi:hypothetical protein
MMIHRLAMSFSIETKRLTLRLRTNGDAVWNLELLGEHEGGTALTLAEADQRLAEQNLAAHESGLGLLAIQRRAEGDLIGYCGLLIGRGTFDEPEIAYELLRRFHGTAMPRRRPALFLKPLLRQGGGGFGPPWALGTPRHFEC